MFLITPTYQRCRALLALGRGDAAEARRWAEPALEEAAARGYAWPVLEASRALGQRRCSRTNRHGRPPTCAPCGSTRSARGSGAGRVPGRGRAGRGADASSARSTRRDAVTERLRALAASDHPWAHATLARCEGRHDEAALAFEALGLRFDAARARLAHGRALRRERQWRAAREALEGAAAAFEALGSPGWAGQAKAELTRVGGRKPRKAGELTETERQVARLAAAGPHQQGDRAGPVRDRPHGRGAPLEHVREARRQDPYAARRAPLKTGSGNFAGAAVASARALPISLPCPNGLDAPPLHALGSGCPVLAARRSIPLAFTRRP